MERKKQQFPLLKQHLLQLSMSIIEKKRFQLTLLQQKTADASPAKLLARGYSITLKNGKVIKDASLLKPGDEIVTKLKRGEVSSIVK